MVYPTNNPPINLVFSYNHSNVFKLDMFRLLNFLCSSSEESHDVSCQLIYTGFVVLPEAVETGRSVNTQKKENESVRKKRQEHAHKQTNKRQDPKN